MARLPGEITGTRVLKAFARLGWVVVAQDGSHRKLRKPGESRFLIVAFHRTLSRHSIRQALRAANIPEEEFLRKL